VISWPTTYYTDADHFAREQETIFERSWICVVRSSEIPAVGSFVRARAGGEDLIITRKRDGSVGAYINVCRHRGAELCSTDRGEFGKSIQCPYHGWTFDLEGQLVGAPFMRDLPAETRERHLFKGQTAEWLGYVWVNLDLAAPPLSAQVGPMVRERFGDVDVIGHYEPERLDIAKTATYEVDANWKILYENFCECYHCPTMHPEICNILPSWRGGYGTVSGPDGPKAEGSPLAPEATGFSLSGKAAAAVLPGVPERDKRSFHGLLLWPNVHLMFIPDHVMCMRFEPVAAERTRVVVDWLFAPEAIGTPGFSPDDAAALVEVTALEDFEACEMVQRAAHSKYFEEFHTPHEALIQDFRAWVLETLGEPVPARAGAAS
jgi:Rieske 2Fe-2S family protein